MLTGCGSNTDKPVEAEDVIITNKPIETEESTISLSKSIIIYNHSFTNVLYNSLKSVSPEEINGEFLYVYIDEDNPYYNYFQFNYDNDGTLIQAIYPQL